MTEPIYDTTLVFDWEYTVWGFRKRNYEHPSHINGRHKVKVRGTMSEIQKALIQTIREYGRKKVKNWYWWEDKIANDSVELYHVREATLWTQLEVVDHEEVEYTEEELQLLLGLISGAGGALLLGFLLL
jgi:hypothetical protein